MSERPIVRLFIATAIGFLFGAIAADPARAQTWDELEAQQATIAGVEIVVTDVFDVRRAGEDTWIGRAANAVHVQTRRSVVERELLFAVGDRVDARRILETERNLRRYSFIRDARITPARHSPTTVWARVEVFDAWSLRTSASLQRDGGRTEWDASLDEANLLGRGKRLRVAHGRNRERNTTAVSYMDPQILGSRWIGSVSVAGLSDGDSRSVAVERPFYSVETPYAVGGFASTTEYSLTQYDRTEPVHGQRVQTSAGAVYGARAVVTSGRTAVRVGVRYEIQDTTFGEAVALGPTPLPAPQSFTRRLRGVSATVGLVQDRPATFRNLASIGQPEDYNLGWTLSGRAGRFSTSLGSTTPAPFGGVSVTRGWRTPDDGLLLAAAAIEGRHEAPGWRETRAYAELTAYYRPVAWQTLAANIHVTSIAGPAPDDWLYLDSSAGLRGYPDHFQAGDRRVVFSFDDRIITEWRLLGLLQVGFVGYFDAGAIRRFDTGRWSRIYVDVGGGLRFGSLRASRHNVLQASIAVPLVRDADTARIFLVLGNTVRF